MTTDALPAAAVRLAKSIEALAENLDKLGFSDVNTPNRRAAAVRDLDELAATLERVERTIAEIDGEEVTTITAELDTYDPDPADMTAEDLKGRTVNPRGPGGSWTAGHGSETVHVQLDDPPPEVTGYVFQLTPLEAQRLADALRHQAFAVIVEKAGE